MRDPAGEPRLVDVDDQHRTAVEGDGKRLRAAHAAASARQGEGPREGLTPEGASHGGEGLVGALQNALRADVDPGSRGHLPVHRETEGLQPAELGPRRPVAHEVRVGDEHPRRPLVGAENPHGLARLHEQGLVGGELVEGAHDGVIRLPRAGRAARAPVDDKVFGVLGDLGVEVVHQHPLGGFGTPTAGGLLGAARRPDRTGHAFSSASRWRG